MNYDNVAPAEMMDKIVASLKRAEKKMPRAYGSKMANGYDAKKILNDKILPRYGLKIKDTNGLPFNGTTYEIYREMDMNGRHFLEIVGHYKYVVGIYGNTLDLYFYNDVVDGRRLEGGGKLNKGVKDGGESGLYFCELNFAKKG